MKFERLPAPDYLKAYVRYFWILESNPIDRSPKALGPLADGCPGIIFQPVENGVFYDQYAKPLPEIFLYGQTIKRTAIYLTGQFKTIGICFHPHALKSIFGFNAHELTDDCLDVNLLSKEFYLSEQLLHTPSAASLIEILSAYLFSQVSKNRIGVDEITHYALSQIIQSKGRVSLTELQKKSALSERSLERRFKQYVGISPKLFAGVCRFQASLCQLKNNQYTKLSDIAFDNGYADQSHFIRTFKDFAGFPPHQLQKQAHQIAGDFPQLIQPELLMRVCTVD